MQYLALFALMAMIHISSSEIHCWTEGSWRLSFDQAGWSHCGDMHYVRGFYRQENPRRRHFISLLEYARCCGPPTPNANMIQSCKSADWTTTLDSNDEWALCPMGHFLEGVRRIGGGLHQGRQEIKQALQHIEEGNCCKPKNLPNSYLECKIKDVNIAFERRGWGECDPGYYL
ncbi:hypothetical protein P5673_018418, partial [Acropora cervicornis]